MKTKRFYEVKGWINVLSCNCCLDVVVFSW